ncbi:MAG: hypothetical protein B6244_02710 [Candidatus Cloacimonetes bacterium 4572_55]|nr:MAG: hypothetical protein B6244_02710 [Candidatus Cloacimonetes bacterium 4572_55]
MREFISFTFFLVGLILLVALLGGAYLVYQSYYQSRRIAELSTLGDLYAIQGDYDKAGIAYQSALSIRQTKIVREKWENLAVMEEQERRLMQESQHLSDLSDASQVAADTLFSQGSALYKAEEYQSAFELFRESLWRFPQHSESRKYLRKSHAQLMDKWREKELGSSKKPIVHRAPPPRPQDQETKIKLDLSYQMISETITDKQEKTEINLFALSNTTHHPALEKVLNRIFLKYAYKAGFQYHDYPTHINVFIYSDQKDFYRDIESWKARLKWERKRDGSKPRLTYSE